MLIERPQTGEREQQRQIACVCFDKGDLVGIFLKMAQFLYINSEVFTIKIF